MIHMLRLGVTAFMTGTEAVGIPPMDDVAFEELRWVLKRAGLTKRRPDLP